MGLDITALAIKVTSEGIQQATKSLNDLAIAATKVEQVSKTTKTASDGLSASQAKGASSTEALLSRMQKQVDLLGANTSQTNSYNMAMKKASDINQQMAAMLGAEVDAYKRLSASQTEAIRMNKSLDASYAKLSKEADKYYAAQAKGAAAGKALNDIGYRQQQYQKLSATQSEAIAMNRAFDASIQRQKILLQNMDIERHAAGVRRYAAAQAEAIAMNNAMDAAARKSTAAMNNHTRGMRDAHDVARGLSGSLGALWLTYGNFAAMGLGIAIGATLKGVLSVGKDVEQTLESLRVKGQESAESIKDIRAAVIDLGQGIYGPRQVAKAFETMVLAGVSAKDATIGIADALNLATVGGTSIEKSAYTIVQVGTALGYSAENYSRIADVIAATAASSMSSVESLSEAFKSGSVVGKLYGVSLVDIGTSLAALSNLGIQGSAAGTSLKNFYKELAAETSKVKNTLKGMKLVPEDFKDAEGNYKNILEVVGTLAKGLSNLTEAEGRKALANLANERGMKTIVELYDLYKKKLDDTTASGAEHISMLEVMRTKIAESYGFAAIGAAQMALTVDAQFKSVGNTIQTQFLKAFQGVSPQLTEIASRLKEAFNSPEFLVGIQTITVAVANFSLTVIENIPLIVNLIKAMVGAKAFMFAVELFTSISVSLRAVGAAAAFAAIPLGPLVVALMAAGAAYAYFTRERENSLVSPEQKSAIKYSQDYASALDQEAIRLEEQIRLMKEGKTVRDAETESMYNRQLAMAAEKRDQAKSAAETRLERAGLGVSFQDQQISDSIVKRGGMPTAKVAELRAAQQAYQEVTSAADNAYKTVETGQQRVMAAAKEKEELREKQAEKEKNDIASKGKGVLDLAKADKTAESAAKAAANEYTNLLTKIQEQITGNKLLISGYDKLSAAQKLAIDLDAAIATGKNKISDKNIKFIKEQIEIARVQEGVIETQKKAAQGLEDYNKIHKEYTDETNNTIKKAEEEASKNEELVKTFGMTKGAIEDLELARMKQRLEQRASVGMTLEEVVALEKLIAAQERNAAARNTLDVLQAEKKANEEKLKDWNESVKKYDDIFSKGFADMVNNGKGAWKSFTKSLVTTFKTSVADQIYKMFAQPFIVKIIGSVLGITGASGVANAASGASNAIGTASDAYGLYSNASKLANWVGGLGATAGTAGALGGSAAVGSLGTISAAGGSLGMTAGGSLGFSALGGTTGLTAAGTTAAGTLGGTAATTGIGASVSGALAAIPVWGWAAMAAVAVASLGGRGEKKITEQGVEGTFNGDSFQGVNFAKWEQKGGLFHSDRDGKKTSPLDEATMKQVTDGFVSVKSAATGFAKSMGLDADTISTYSKKISVTLTKDAAKNQEAFAAMYTSIGEDMAKSLLTGMSMGTDVVDSDFYLSQNPDVAKSKWKNDAQGHYDRYGKGEGRLASAQEMVGVDYSHVVRENETYSAALQRLSVSLVAVNGMFDALNLKLYDTSIIGADMASKLVDLFGGLESMQKVSADYFTNYYSEQERVDITTRQLSKSFSDLGYVMPSTKEALRGMIEGLDLTTEGGRKSYAELMNLSGAFSQLAQSAINSTEQIRQALLSNADSAMEVLQASVNREKDAAQAAYDAQIAIINAQKSSAEEVFNNTKTALTETLNAATASNTAFKSLASSLKSTLDGMYLVTQQAMRRQSAQEMIAAALQVARNTGVLPTAESLSEALKTVAQPSENLFATFEDYATDFGVTAGQIADLNDITNEQVKKSDTAVDLAKMQLNMLETNHKSAMVLLTNAEASAKSFYDSEVARLDGILLSAQAQIDAANGTTVAVVSVKDAIASLTAAVLALASNQPAKSATNAALAASGTAKAIAHQTGAGNVSAVQTPVTSSDTSAIESLYQEYFGRASDPEGLAYWEQGVRNGASMDNIRQSFENIQSDLINGSHAAGLTKVPFDNYVANLHAGERVLTSRQAAEADTTAEEVRKMREEMNAALQAIASNTGKQAKLSQKWDGDGLPEVRDTLAA